MTIITQIQDALKAHNKNIYRPLLSVVITETTITLERSIPDSFYDDSDVVEVGSAESVLARIKREKQ